MCYLHTCQPASMSEQQAGAHAERDVQDGLCDKSMFCVATITNQGAAAIQFVQDSAFHQACRTTDHFLPSRGRGLASSILREQQPHHTSRRKPPTPCIRCPLLQSFQTAPCSWLVRLPGNWRTSSCAVAFVRTVFRSDRCMHRGVGSLHHLCLYLQDVPPCSPFSTAM